MKKDYFNIIYDIFAYIIRINLTLSHDGERVEITFNAQFYDGKDDKGDDKFKSSVVQRTGLKNPTRVAV